MRLLQSRLNGCLAILAALAVGCHGCGSGASQANTKPKVQIFDSANLLQVDANDQLSASLQRLADTTGADVVVTSALEVPQWRISIEGDRAGDVIFAPDAGRWTKFWSDEPDNDIVFFVTETPSLVQVRFGDDLEMQARAAGLDCGPLYEETQRAAMGGAATAQIDLAAAAEAIGRHWIKKEDLSWSYRWIVNATRGEIGSALDHIKLPDVGIWIFAMKLAPLPVSVLVANVTDSPFGWLGILFSVGWLIHKIVTWICAKIGRRILATIGTERPPGTSELIAVGAVMRLIAGAFGMFLALPEMSVMLLSFSGRAEDKLALAGLSGSCIFDRMPAFPAHFGLWTTILLSAALVIFGLYSAWNGSDESILLGGQKDKIQQLVFSGLPANTQAALTAKFALLVEAKDRDVGVARGEEDGLDDRFRRRPFGTLRELGIHAATRRSLASVLMLWLFPAFLAAYVVFAATIKGLQTAANVVRLRPRVRKISRSLDSRRPT